MLKSIFQHWSSILRSLIKVITNYWQSLAHKLKPSITRDDKVNLDQLLSRVNSENKHDLIFCEGHKHLNHLTPIEEESFTIQISVESYEQVKRRWTKEMKSLDDGVFSEPTKRLSFETWEDFFDIFSDKGKAMIEELRSAKGECGDCSGDLRVNHYR